MLSALAVRGLELLAAAMFAGTVLLAITITGVWWLQRRMRRRLLAVGLAAAGRAAAGRAAAARAHRAAAGGAGAGRRWLWSRPLPDRRWVAAGRARRRLWRSVGAAEHAVALARQAAAPTGDLDSLCRRLRAAACDADRSLAIARRATTVGHEPVSAQVADLVSTAEQIQRAAAAALASMSSPAASSLADDVHREVVALADGIASAASAAGAAGSTRPLGLT